METNQKKIIIAIIVVVVLAIIYGIATKNNIVTRFVNKISTGFFIDSIAETNQNKKLLCTAMLNKYGGMPNARWGDVAIPNFNTYKNLWIQMDCNNNFDRNYLVQDACKVSSDSQFKKLLGCSVTVKTIVYNDKNGWSIVKIIDLDNKTTYTILDDKGQKQYDIYGDYNQLVSLNSDGTISFNLANGFVNQYFAVFNDKSGFKYYPENL